MDSTKITSLSNFVQIITGLNCELERNGADKNEVLLFRGQEDKKFELIPSIGRKRKSSVDISLFNEERNLIEIMKMKLPKVFNQNMTPLELLALLQHHGIPTRLLDVTENALVALYFACLGDLQADAEVIVFKINELDITNYPICNAIADSYRFSNSTFHNLSIFYEDVIEQPYFLEQRRMQRHLNKTSEDAENWIIECCKTPIFIYAPIATGRQSAQKGRYILFPNHITKGESGNYFESYIDPILKDSECICRQIIIPANLKTEIISQLRLFGITQETLFPDDVDKICEDVLHQYQNKIHPK